MADRSGFYINGDKICRVDVKIDWNLGFDKLAKEAYVAELITELSKVCPLKLKKVKKLYRLKIRH